MSPFPHFTVRENRFTEDLHHYYILAGQHPDNYPPIPVNLKGFYLIMRANGQEFQVEYRMDPYPPLPVQNLSLEMNILTDSNFSVASLPIFIYNSGDTDQIVSIAIHADLMVYGEDGAACYNLPDGTGFRTIGRTAEF
jgi:hypothetical protein